MISKQHWNIELYSCISFESQFFKQMFHLKQINVHRGPLGAIVPSPSSGPARSTKRIRLTSKQEQLRYS